jgi:hypothetical protein
MNPIATEPKGNIERAVKELKAVFADAGPKKRIESLQRVKLAGFELIISGVEGGAELSASTEALFREPNGACGIVQ